MFEVVANDHLWDVVTLIYELLCQYTDFMHTSTGYRRSGVSVGEDSGWIWSHDTAPKDSSACRGNVCCIDDLRKILGGNMAFIQRSAFKSCNTFTVIGYISETNTS
jgi:hypothetical protein